MLKCKGIISNFQKELLSSFSRIKDADNFYLTGGTALAEFFFAHRKSFDLDIFTVEKQLIIPFSRVVEEELKETYNVLVIRRFETLVEYEIARDQEKVKLQIAYDTPFRFGPPEDSELGIKVNDFKDLIVDKLLAFFGRSEPRDAVDLYFILQRESLWNLTELASQKDKGFDLYWLGAAFEKVEDFPDNINNWPIEMLVELDAKELKNYFINLANELMKKIK